ncbi:MAG: hypothetical protein VX992_07610, partial [Acidobacteriota bacterium]|nr:hypothetical protein [Acidobacteriota bacterium]
MSDNPDERPLTAHEFASAFEGITSTTSTVGKTEATSATSAADSEVNGGATEPISELVVESTADFEEGGAVGEAWNSNSQEPAEWVGSEEDEVVSDLPMLDEKSRGTSRSEPSTNEPEPEPVTLVEMLDVSEDSKPSDNIVRAEAKNKLSNQGRKSPTPAEVESILSAP